MYIRRPMRRSFLVGVGMSAAVAACVDVPDSVRAEFAAAGPTDRSNFRRGTHGSASPVEEPPAPKAALGAPDAGPDDAGPDAEPDPAADVPSADVPAAGGLPDADAGPAPDDGGSA